jgi:ABC-2 type transport system ATP-binding protein
VGGTTLLVSSHVMDEADRCDDLVLLREGRVLVSGTPQSLRETTGTTDLDAAFLSLIDEVDGERS